MAPITHKGTLLNKEKLQQTAEGVLFQTIVVSDSYKNKPNDLEITFWGEKTERLEMFTKGDSILIDFVPRTYYKNGRKHTRLEGVNVYRPQQQPTKLFADHD